MRVVIVVDKIHSAIHRLARGVKKYNPHHKIAIVAVHPKRPTPDSIDRYKRLAKDADIIDFQYWKTALMLLEEYPEVIKDQKLLLQHHNPYSISENNWKQFHKVITNNQSIKKELFEKHNVPSDLIYNTIDLNTFTYKQDYKWNKTVGMVAGRIESKKGIKEVAEICEELGYKFILVGRLSDRNYFNSFKDLKCLDFRENISEEELRVAYHDMGCLVVNSVPNFESGPLPPLEAMASGIPVVSNMVGTMKDILRDSNNCVVHNRKDLKYLLQNLGALELDKIRNNGWELVKQFDDRRRAKIYSKLYYSINSYDMLVSVIIPTAERIENLTKIISSLDEQTWKNIEIIIADDGNIKIDPKAIAQLRELSSHPIKYIDVPGSGYQLAKARNMAVMEAEGEALLFLDDRLLPEPNAIEKFIKMSSYPQEWLFGNKGANKKAFVENFSFIRRKEFIEAGMFNQLIDRYGGISEEIRTRFKRQNFQFRYVNSAKATPISGTHRDHNRRKDIIEAKYLLFKLYK